MDHFAGLDVSVKETSICIVDDAGKIVREVKVASEPEALLAVLKNLAYHFKRIGLEAGPLSQWLFSALAEAGLPVICVETRHMQAVLWSTTPSTSCTSMASTRARRHWSSGSDPIEVRPGSSSDIGANTSRSLEAVRIVDRRLKAERGNRTETGRGHEFANLHIMARQLQNLTYARHWQHLTYGLLWGIAEN